MSTVSLIDRAEQARTANEFSRAIGLYLQAAKESEVADADVCLKLARTYEQVGELQEAFRWASRVVDATDDFRPWSSASSLIARLAGSERPKAAHSAPVAVTGSYTTSQLASMLPLAALRDGVDLIIHEGLYAQYQQELLDPRSALYEFDPDYVVVAVHEGTLELPRFAGDPDAAVAAELARWQRLWQAVFEHSGAEVVQHNFAVRPEVALGHLAGAVPGYRQTMVQALNLRLADVGGDALHVVDCDRLASSFGRRRWFDEKYWHLAKQAVALDALPLLARHTVAVLRACMGLSRKCLVLDLDNTLWGGVVGEDGLAGLTLGGGAEGEAFVAFQEYVLELKERGVILAVASKNNEADAREAFEHPDMRIRLEDLSVFLANWEDKPANLRTIAKRLDIGLDSMVLVDDNPAEREAVRELLPEVDVLNLPESPFDYRGALADYLGFEAAAFTEEDRKRTSQYRARAEAAAVAETATSMEDFYRGLEMEALVAPFDEVHLPRIVQLVGKTNQFNLTTRRHGAGEIGKIADDPDWIHFYLRLRDRFTDHGLVGVLMAQVAGDTADIDTLLMSCRVIGRTVEDTMLMHLCCLAHDAGCTKLRGTYLPTAKNEIVRELYPRFGFRLVEESAEGTVWEYDMEADGSIEGNFIRLLEGVGDDSRAA